MTIVFVLPLNLVILKGHIEFVVWWGLFTEALADIEKGALPDGRASAPLACADLVSELQRQDTGS